MNVVMTATPNYIDYTRVAIHSMVQCTPIGDDNPHNIVVFLDQTSSEDRN
ncbi:MAG: hypothetical protein LBJ78_04075 [Puniceicoccales bacterium]|nr:hypothetical protein [Puniceicoccales bacterium]